MLKARVITALFLLAGLLGVLFVLPTTQAAVAFAVIAALAAWEWAGLMKIDRPARVMYACVTLLFCWQAFVGGISLFLLLWIASAGFWLLLVPLWLHFRWSLSGNDFIGYAIGLLLTVPTWAAMVALHQRAPNLLLAAMALVWVADIAAYFIGRRFGRHKLAPSISPGKTWEGAMGATAGTTIYAVVLVIGTDMQTALTPLGMLLGLLLVALLTAVSITGDLFESLMKRQAEVKDSSSLLPGHGGILDRIDSLTAALPLTALAMVWSGR